jgi:hypothetical protein
MGDVLKATPACIQHTLSEGQARLFLAVVPFLGGQVVLVKMLAEPSPLAFPKAMTSTQNAGSQTLDAWAREPFSLLLLHSFTIEKCGADAWHPSTSNQPPFLSPPLPFVSPHSPFLLLTFFLGGQCA